MPHFYMFYTYLNKTELGNGFYSFILKYEEKLLSNKETDQAYSEYYMRLLVEGRKM